MTPDGTGDVHDVPSIDQIVNMQDPANRDQARAELNAAAGPDFERARRRWWAIGRLVQRPDRAARIADAHDGVGEWRAVGGAA